MSRIESLRRIANKTQKALHIYGLAMELRSCGELDESLKVFAELREKHPDYVPAYFMQAQVHEGRGELEEADALLVKGIALAEAEHDDHAANEMRAMRDTLR